MDQQVSKAILGQTTSTDAISGSHAVSKQHHEVAGDIERTDAKLLQAILNRDLIRPWIRLEFGEQQAYPRLVIARPEEEDLTTLTTALGVLGSGAVKADLLANLTAAVDKAISQSTGLDPFKRDFKALVEKNGWHGWIGEGTKKGKAWRIRDKLDDLSAQPSIDLIQDWLTSGSFPDE